jgi:hypothetical protein
MSKPGSQEPRRVDREEPMLRETETWRRYLEAEASGRGAEAEAALAALFAALPQPAPAAGFTARVIARIGRPSVFSRLPVRAALAAVLAFAALATALLAPPLASLAGAFGPSGLVAGGADLATALSLRFAAGLSAWSSITAVGEVLARALVHPPVLLLLLIQFPIAAGALVGLARLAVERRDSNHAAH